MSVTFVTEEDLQNYAKPVHLVSGTKRVVVSGEGVSLGDDEAGDGVTLSEITDKTGIPTLEARTNVDAQLARFAIGDPNEETHAVNLRTMETHINDTIAENDKANEFHWIPNSAQAQVGHILRVKAVAKNGYISEVEGIDYYTPEDQAELENFLTEELAKRGQLKPEFANSIDECTDTSKIYVLPDGYLYAYVYSSTTEETGENILPTLTPLEGLTKNETGLYYGVYATTSGGHAADTNCITTGMIPCTADNRPTLYIKGVHWDSSSSHSRVMTIQKNGTPQQTFNISALTDSAFTLAELDTNYYKLDVNDSAFQSSSGVTMDIGHIVLSFDNTTGQEDIIVSLEPIEVKTVGGYTWMNTGHAFVPADYESRIVGLESHISTLGRKVEEINVGSGGVPVYVSLEAERVAKLTQQKRTVGSLTFTAMSDSHVFVGTTTDWLKPNETSVRDAGYGLSELRKHLTLDFVAMLGDYTYGAPECTVDQVKKDLQYFKQCMSDGCRGIPNIWATGNHDINYGANSDRRMTEDELFAHIGSNNVGTTQDFSNMGRNYGYIDFENQRIRCIYLNSVDALDYPDNIGSADDALEITAIQTQWLVNTGLDLSSRQNPSDWQIVVFSHQPLNLYDHVLTVLEAYRNGTSGSVSVTTNDVTTPVSYDFSEVTRGEIIANIHGHNHNFLAKKIGISENWLWRICTPNMDVTRNNEAATSSDTSWKEQFGEFNENGEPIYYKKTQGTATSTSFCVFTIDRKNRKIHALHYGAGIDREVSY